MSAISIQIAQNNPCAIQTTMLRIGQNIKDELAVVDVRRLGGGEMEPWLTGVPTLLDVSEKTVFRGTKCLDFLDRLATVPNSNRER